MVSLVLMISLPSVDFVSWYWGFAISGSEPARPRPGAEEPQFSIACAAKLGIPCMWRIGRSVRSRASCKNHFPVHHESLFRVGRTWVFGPFVWGSGGLLVSSSVSKHSQSFAFPASPVEERGRPRLKHQIKHRRLRHRHGPDGSNVSSLTPYSPFAMTWLASCYRTSPKGVECYGSEEDEHRNMFCCVSPGVATDQTLSPKLL